jgi:hypothetical protein
MWMVGLIAVSIVLFLIGVAVERQGETHEQPAPQVTASAGGEGQTETGGEPGHTEANQPAAQTGEQAYPEAILGINPDNPWLVAGVVLGSIILAAAALRFGYRVLVVIALAFIIMAAFDVREAVIQILRSNNGIAAIAGMVVLSRVAVAVVSFIAWNDHRKVLGQAAKG